jgi:hypothetical protein
VWGTLSLAKHPSTLWVGVISLVLKVGLGLLLAGAGLKLGTLMAPTRSG